MEFFLVVNAMLNGREVTTCPHIWVDRDFALMRGWFQGFPKKLGSIWMTRHFGLQNGAEPGLQSGATFGGTCAANDRRLAQGTVTLEDTTDVGPTHNSAQLVNVRHFPRLNTGLHDKPAVHELAGAVSRDRSSSEMWEGTASLELFRAPNEEHTALAPVRMGKGFRFTFAYTVDDQTNDGDLRTGG